VGADLIESIYKATGNNMSKL